MFKGVSLALAAILLAAPALAQPPQSGKWTGLGLEVNNDSETQIYPIEVRINQDGDGAIDYPDLACGGRLTTLRTVDGVREYRETLTYGTDNCVDGGTVSLWQRGDKVMFYWTGEGTTEPDAVVSAVLREVVSKTRR